MRVITPHNEEWYFSITDVVKVLTDSTDPKQYIKKMRARDPELSSKWGTICTPVKMIGLDGKHRNIQAVTTTNLLRLIQYEKEQKLLKLAEQFNTNYALARNSEEYTAYTSANKAYSSTAKKNLSNLLEGTTSHDLWKKFDAYDAAYKAYVAAKGTADEQAKKTASDEAKAALDAALNDYNAENKAQVTTEEANLETLMKAKYDTQAVYQATDAYKLYRAAYKEVSTDGFRDECFNAEKAAAVASKGFYYWNLGAQA